MPEPQLSVRSARARDLAHRLARRERTTVAEIVERALEAYERREAPNDPPEVSISACPRPGARTSRSTRSFRIIVDPIRGQNCDLSGYERRLGDPRAGTGSGGDVVAGAV